VPDNVTDTAEVFPAWFSYKEAEVWSGLSRTTLWSLVSSGQIKAARVGRAVRLSRRSLEDYMESRTKDVGDGR
jgi:excisionase family DNA binding protein